MTQKKYFNINLEFDIRNINNIVEETIKCNGKGYVCYVEGNILANSYINPYYLKIINNAIVNACDGSSIALLASIIHRRKYTTTVGNDLFLEYIERKKYIHYFIGNKTNVLDGLKTNLIKIDPRISNMTFTALPFLEVEKFNYPEIANAINLDEPDIIFVSLGAPKQEEFMYRLLPFLNKGVLFGCGAIFNFNSGIRNNQKAPSLISKCKLEWLYILYQSPKKQFPRIKNIIKTYPKLIYGEIINKLE